MIVMGSSWDLMQHGTAVEYMYSYRERYYGCAYKVYEDKAWGTRSWPTLPYPEASRTLPEVRDYYTEEQILGILLAIGQPPVAADSSCQYPKTTDAVMFVWRQKLNRFVDEPYLAVDSMALVNTIKQYLNFEHLKQLERHDD